MKTMTDYAMELMKLCNKGWMNIYVGEIRLENTNALF